MVAAVLFAASCGELPVGEGGTQVTAAGQAPALRAPQATQQLVQSQVCVDTDPACTPTGAHAKHGGYACSVCHKVAGRLSFDSSGPAYGDAGSPAPSFDATAKTCSNVACHGVKAGTFSYYFPGNETDADGYPIPELKTVHYGGTMAAGTPSWYATNVGCTACHGNPPVNGSDGSNAWHSGWHANRQNVGAINANACELCHNSTAVPYGTWLPIALSQPDSSGFWRGYEINVAVTGQHGNGTASVNAKFVSQCFGCH